jgi:hypothetical protein
MKLTKGELLSNLHYLCNHVDGLTKKLEPLIKQANIDTKVTYSSHPRKSKRPL